MPDELDFTLTLSIPVTVRLLAINDASSRQTRWMAREPTKDSTVVNVDMGQARLRGQLLELMENGLQFRNCVFSTHGNEGVIFFGDSWIDAQTWYTEFYQRGFDQLFPFPNTKIYFDGCNVGAGSKGWRFLEAAARSLLGRAGGVAIAWTSSGFHNPLLGHALHYWGDIRQVSIGPGGQYLRFHENGILIKDANGFPVRPD